MPSSTLPCHLTIISAQPRYDKCTNTSPCHVNQPCFPSGHVTRLAVPRPLVPSHAMCPTLIDNQPWKLADEMFPLILIRDCGRARLINELTLTRWPVLGVGWLKLMSTRFWLPPQQIKSPFSRWRLPFGGLLVNVLLWTLRPSREGYKSRPGGGRTGKRGVGSKG